MADFRPFRGWRYDPEKIDPEQVIAPPYDIISPEKQTKLYEKSVFNCVRLILNKEEPSDNETDNRYTRARYFFHDWQKKGLLIQEKEPAFYLYRQIFNDTETGEPKERNALLGVLKLEPFDKGIVIPHEKTLKKPCEDRKKLLKTCRTNFSPVFGLYEDPPQKLAALYRKLVNSPANFEASDDDQTRHYLWVIRDQKLNQEIHQILSEKKIYIADGHHRYQTALEHALDCRRIESVSAETELLSDFVLMALVEFHDPGLVIFPTHRMVSTFEFAANIKSAGDISERLIKPLRDFFEVRAVKKDDLISLLKVKNDSKIVFGLMAKDQSFFLELKDWQNAKRKMPTGKPDVWYQLDVTILAHLVLASLWGIPESKWESVLRYTHSTEEAVRAVENGNVEVSFLLQAPKVEILREMGNAGELLPQKSTYFYPKLASGTVFYQHSK